MKKILLALFLIFTPAIAGCSTISRMTNTEQLVTADEKSLIAAELAFQQIAQLIIIADTSGLLTAERKTKLLPLFNQGYSALIQARAAYDANDKIEASLAQNNALGAILQIVTLLQEWKIVKGAL